MFDIDLQDSSTNFDIDMNPSGEAPPPSSETYIFFMMMGVG